MQILILEDELPAALRIEKLIKQIEPEAQICQRIDSIADAISFLNQNQPDLIVSDVELSDGLCFETFARTNTEIPIIFTTAYNQYAIRAFEANAIDYLLKPVKISRLTEAFGKFHSRTGYKRPQIDFEAIARAIRDKTRESRKRYLIRYGSKMVVQDPNEAAFFYSVHKSTFIVLGNGKSYPLDESLTTVEKDVDSKTFFRINRNFIVNINSISSMSAYSKGRVQLHVKPAHEDEKHLIVSADRSPDFKKWLKGE